MNYSATQRSKIQIALVYISHLAYLIFQGHQLVVNSTSILLLLLLRWRYSPGWALASFTIRLQASRSLALSLHSFIPIFLRSVDTSSRHLIFGLPLRLVAYSFPYNIFFWNCGVLHSFYVTKPSYSLAFNEPDNVLHLNYTVRQLCQSNLVTNPKKLFNIKVKFKKIHKQP